MTHGRVRIDGRVHEVELREGGRAVVVDGVSVAIGDIDGTGLRAVTCVVDGQPVRVMRRSLHEVEVDGEVSTFTIERVATVADAGVVGAEGAEVRPPMPGRVVRVRVEVGAPVEKGAVLFVLEAMKMQNEVTSPATGTVRAVKVASGATVDTGDVVIVLGPPQEEEERLEKVVA